MDALVNAGRKRRAARHTACWLAIALALAILLATALAHAELRSSPVPVTEAGCDLDIALVGPVARVSETHRLAAPGKVPALAAYSAALPRGAVVDGFSVTVAGRNEPGVLLPAESLDNLTPASLALPPDLATLRVRIEDGHPIVDARLYPVSPSRITEFTLRWSAPTTYDSGTMTLLLPARGSGENLGRCRVRLGASPGAGIRGWSSVRAGGVWVGAGARVRGTVSGAAASDVLAIDARPIWSSAAPVLAAAHATGSGGSVPSTLALYVPDAPVRRRFAPARLLFVVDTSRSVGDAGRRAAVTLIENLGRAAPAGTPVEAVLFDRTARRVLGTWTPGTSGGITRIARAVREAPMAGGTDLADALALAAASLGGEPGHVVLITDGVLPRSQSGAELLGAFQAPAGRVVVDVLVPLASNAAPPERGALDTLAHVYGGRVVALAADHPTPIASLTEGLAAGAPVADLSIEADGQPLDHLELPDVLAAGSGILLTTSLHRRPRRLLARARRGNSEIIARSIALPAGAERFAVAELLTTSSAARHGQPATADERTMAATARRLGIITAGTAMMVIDRRAPGGSARHDLARRTGAVTYTAPPETLASETPSAPVQVVADARTRRIGELPLSSVQLALRDQLVPRIRRCYADALRGAPTLAGDLVVELEIARTEVMSVELGGDHFPETMIGCIADAAYAMTTPAYELGGQPDTVFVVRKPIRFRAPAPGDAGPTVSLDDVLYPATNPAGRPALEVEADAPL